MEEMEACLNLKEFGDLCRAPKGREGRWDLEVHCQNVRAPVRVVRRKEESSAAVVGALDSKDRLGLGGMNGTPAGVRVDGP